MFTPTAFRANFSAFADSTAFPDPDIAFWTQLGYKMHDAGRYGNFLDEAVQLFVAHNLSLESNTKQNAAQGQSPGMVVGALTSGSVGGVSYSRDPGAAMDPKNGHWNLSSYGLRWVFLMRMAGAGGVQVGAPSAGDLSFSASASAWYGPYGGSR